MRERLMVSFFLALVVHLVAFLILQQLLRIERSRLPERIGPVVVELAEVPVPAQVRERPPEPRRQPAAPEAAAAAPRTRTPAEVPAAAPAGRPRVAPGVPTPKPQTEESLIPRTSSRAQPRVLPPEPTGTEPAPAVRSPQPQPQPPAYNQPVPVPREQEVRPQAGVDQPSLLDLRQVDRALDGEAAGSAAPASGAASGGATTSGGKSGGSAAGSPTGSPGDYSIEWAHPEQGRNPRSTPAPVIPAWVSQQGLRLQVTASFVLTPDGVLREVRVKQSSGYSEVDTAVLDALRRWRFDSAQGGSDVNGLVRYSIVPR